MMIRSPGGKLSLWRRKNSRRRRLTRLRREALPTLRPATSPNRRPVPSPGARQTPKCGVCSFFPRAWALRYSRRRRSRSSLVNRAALVAASVLPGTCARLEDSGACFSEAPCISHREALAALGPAALQNPAAPPGAHAPQEAVSASPAPSTRLKSAFHRNSSSGTNIVTNFL